MTGESAAQPTLGEAAAVWFRIGCLGFGGPAGQIALMHRTLVDEKRWVPEDRFLHALNFCMLLPGPEAQQLATYCGWLLHGTRGGVIAGILFILPGFILMMVLAALYAVFHDTAWLQSIFFGIKAAVLAIVVEALIRIGRRTLKGPGALGIAAASFAAIFVFGVPFPLIIVVAALVGLLSAFRDRPAASLPAEPEAQVTPDTRPLATLAVWGVLWVVPILLLVGAFGAGSIFVGLAAYFSQMAVVTFGGAYAVLAYVAQTVVSSFHWLTTAQMVDGLALAETTPGPLILVLTFVGFLAAYGAPGGLPPLAAGLLGGLVATWVTFVPSFLWIFLGAPYVERLRANRLLSGVLAAITAAVVGIILNLALYLALHVLFSEVGALRAGPVRMAWPAWGSLDLLAVLLAAGSAVALFGLRFGVVTTLVTACVLGVAVRLVW